MTTLLLVIAALPLLLRLAARRRDAGAPWLSAPARLAATVAAMVAWLYWCGIALEGSDAAIAKVLGWLVLAAEATAHAGTTTPSRHVTHGATPRPSRPAPTRRDAGLGRCAACGAVLATDRVPTARRARRATPTRPRSRP